MTRCAEPCGDWQRGKRELGNRRLSASSWGNPTSTALTHRHPQPSIGWPSRTCDEPDIGRAINANWFQPTDLFTFSLLSFTFFSAWLTAGWMFVKEIISLGGLCNLCRGKEKEMNCQASVSCYSSVSRKRAILNTHLYGARAAYSNQPSERKDLF